MLCQNEPMFDIAQNVGGILKTQFPVIKNAVIGWPDRKFLQVEKNLPAIFFTDVSEKSEHQNPQFARSSTTPNSIKFEKMMVWILVQITLFTNTSEQRDNLGFGIKQYLVSDYHIPILDYTQATPADTGEFLLLTLMGDHREEKGEANLYQRDLTFKIQTRILDAIPAYKVSEIDDTNTFQAGTKTIIDTQTKKESD